MRPRCTSATGPSPQGRHDEALAAQVDASRRLVALGRAARTDAKVRVRQPLARALLLHPGIELDPAIEDEIMTELNVRSLERIDTLSGLMSWTVVPNFRTLGPRLGPRVNEVKAALAAADGSALQQALEQDGFVEIAGERLEPADVDVRAERHDDFALADDDGWAVALDLEIDDGLRREGQARELVRALNDRRKELGFAIADRVAVTIGAPDELQPAVDAHRDWIAAEVLAVELRRRPAGPATTCPSSTSTGCRCASSCAWPDQPGLINQVDRAGPRRWWARTARPGSPTGRPPGSGDRPRRRRSRCGSVAPEARRAPTRSSRSSTSMAKRFHPPGSGTRPSGMTCPPPPGPPGALSTSRRSPRASMAKVGAGCITSVKPRCVQ